VELLKQPQYLPMPVEMQLIQVIAGLEGICNDIPAAKTVAFANALRDHFEANQKALLTEFREKLNAGFQRKDDAGKVKSGDEKKMDKDKIIQAIRDFKSVWKA
jgi:F0F1-type ATP synthase alpha subunit